MIKTGNTKSIVPELFCQPEEVKENGRDEIVKAPKSKIRLNHNCWAEARNKALPAKIMATPHPVAPAGLPSKAEAIARLARPMIQNGRPVTSSGARNHIQPPNKAAMPDKIRRIGVKGVARLLDGM